MEYLEALDRLKTAVAQSQWMRLLEQRVHAPAVDPLEALFGEQARVGRDPGPRLTCSLRSQRMARRPT